MWPAFCVAGVSKGTKLSRCWLPALGSRESANSQVARARREGRDRERRHKSTPRWVYREDGLRWPNSIFEARIRSAGKDEGVESEKRRALRACWSGDVQMML